MSRLTIDFTGLQMVTKTGPPAEILLLRGGHLARLVVELDQIDYADPNLPMVQFTDVFAGPGGVICGNIDIDTGSPTIRVDNSGWPMSPPSPAPGGNLKPVPSINRIWKNDQVRPGAPASAVVSLDHGSLTAGPVVADSQGIPVAFEFRSQHESPGQGVSYPSVASSVQWSASGGGAFSLSVGILTIPFRLGDVAVGISNLPAHPSPTADHFMMYYDLLRAGQTVPTDQRRIPELAGGGKGGGTIKCFVAILS